VKLEYDSIILVGYSYGGPIAGALASNPELHVSKLILLSPSNGSECEPIFWFNKFLNYNFVDDIFPPFVRVANAEKMYHSEALEGVMRKWQNIRAATVHIHSVQDWIAPYACNVDFSRRLISPAILEVVTLENAPHFLPNNKLVLVRGHIIN
jgi:pimeloyl-ACP methyl ester carboxylesterase